ncbi:DUF1700 domain-containing protein [Claveliimonas bilis]|uniref:DUF1700 domain-containing protein n=1 Tax=Clostridia TaxID=186801 RepID=UPI001C3A924B|nr:DUF1700 domain-containing protein [Claveliimonas bilis]MCQ5201106.1 DUF1700 domain-containing protein [Mordavella massiliensis]BDZ80427.1 hypothetical protein Lac3_16360 [Claveliimonas bilis]HIZ61073.1 DUF1700 domain-containing protein [Candidatus Dorea faecipullorum]
MTREEFLKKLKEALENDLSGRIVQENVSYYESYIIEEIRKGRAESEVIEELGDPWVIARSIIDMAEGEPGTKEAYYGSAKSSSRQERAADRYTDGMGKSGNIHVFSMDSWWKKLLVILGVIGIFLIIIAVIGGIFSLLMPIIVPVLCIALIFRLISGRRR